MVSISASLVINKPTQEVFDYAASPLNGPAFIPNLNENSNVQPEQPGVGQTFDWRFNMGGVDLRGSAEVTEYDAPHKVTVVTKGDTSSTWLYTFQDEGGNTKVTLEVEYEVAESALQKLVNRAVVERLNKRTAEQSLENLKTILEG